MHLCITVAKFNQEVGTSNNLIIYNVHTFVKKLVIQQKCNQSRTF